MTLEKSYNYSFLSNKSTTWLDPQETSLNSFAVFFFFILEPNVIFGKVGVKDKNIAGGPILFRFRLSQFFLSKTVNLFSLLVSY